MTISSTNTILPRVLCVLTVVSALALGGCFTTNLNDAPLEPVATAGDLPSEDDLLKKLDEALDITYEKRHLNLKEHAAWQIVHGMLAFEQAFQVEDTTGQRVSALDHVLNGGEMKGWTMEPGIVLDEKTGRRALRAVVEPGTKAGQGHADQWLGYLADCNLKPDQKIKSGEETYTIEDMVMQVEHDVPLNTNHEYSWTLMALTTYRPTNYEWTASDGKKWTVGQLVQIEAEHDLNASPCGGAHRLCGLTMALNRHLDQQGKIEGPWKLADDKIKQSIENARKFQNSDGSFSSNYLARPGKTSDIALSLGSTGHILEFLTLSLSKEELQAPWVKKAVVNMCALLKKTQDLPLECGALYHAAHGLVVYRDRIYGPRSYPAGKK